MLLHFYFPKRRLAQKWWLAAQQIPAMIIKTIIINDEEASVQQSKSFHTFIFTHFLAIFGAYF